MLRHSLGSMAVATLLMACSQAGTPQIRSHAKVPENYAATGWAVKTIPEMSAALRAGEVTSEALVQEFIERVDAIDRNGPKLQSVLILNPDALAQARAIDQRRSDGEALPPLAGLPILFKDNIETKDAMPTTAGAYALAGNVTRRDSPLVAGLRAQGAVVLGKTNLSQWANFRSNESISGWSAMGGQVRNPHMLDRSPCGSSSGSGAAMAASLAAGTVGTETNGSIICPSNVNGIVGFKPTVGLVSQKYIVPISVSQDTAGPMTKTVSGAAMMLSAMATSDNTDFVAALDKDALQGKRIGVMRFSQGENADIIARFNAALAVMEVQGAELVDINDFTPEAENFWDQSLDVLMYEFKDGLNAYLADAPAAVQSRTLTDLIAYNASNDKELALFDQDIFESSDAKVGLGDTKYLKAVTAVKRSTREMGMNRLAVELNLDAFVSPSGPVSPRVDPINGDTWPAWAGAGWIAAIAGYPHITIPMGDVHGVPIGVSIMGLADDDAAILSYGYAYEQASQMRVDPQYYPTAENRPEIKAAMQRD